MADLNPLDLVYRGINTGNAESMAYRGYVSLITTIKKITLQFVVTITKKVRFTIER